MKTGPKSLNILSLNLDTRILDPQSAIAERERAFRNSIGKYSLLVPYSRDIEVPLTESIDAYGIGGSNKLIQLVRIYRKACKLAAQSQYDVLTVQDVYYLAVLGLLVARKYNLGFEIQVHGFEKFSGLRMFISKKTILAADSVRSASQRLKNLLILNFKIPTEKITVAPLNFETESWTTGTELGEKLGAQLLDQEKKDFIFLTIARLVSVKNIILQIEALKMLLARYPDTQLWIVGEGPERLHLENRARDLNISNKVIFWGWQQHTAAFYAHADSYLLSSDSEGWGLVIVEAASYGLPILMTDVGCAGEFIHDGKNGLVVPVGDAKAFEEWMRKLRSQTTLRESLGKAAKDSLSLLPSRDELIERYVSSWRKAYEAARKK